MSATDPAASFRRRPFRTRMELWKEIKANKISYLFIAPFLIMFAVFVVVPILLSIVLSFTYFNMVQPPKWVGWQNYLTLFLEDEVFFIAVKNTLFSPRSQGRSATRCASSPRGSSTSSTPRSGRSLTLMFYAPASRPTPTFIWTSCSAATPTDTSTACCSTGAIIDKPILWLHDPQ